MAATKKVDLNALRKLLQVKQKIKELEAEKAELEEKLFANPDLLPDLVTLDGDTYEKTERAPIVSINTAMLKQASLDPTQIMPVAKFSISLVKQIYGSAGEKKVRSCKMFTEELKLGKPSVFYKLKA